MNEDTYMIEDIWLYKKDACLDALNIADGLLSNYKYPNVKEGDIVPGKRPTEEEVRTCINKLIVSCSQPDVIDCLKKILGLYGSISPDIIVDLRNLVRKELGFEGDRFDEDRDKSFIAKIWGSK